MACGTGPGMPGPYNRPMRTTPPVTRAHVLDAAEVVRGAVRRTPLLDAEQLGAGVRLKAELLQHTGSFKARGVTNRLAALGADERERGVIGVSAGNHAAALAWGAQRAGVDCVVVMWASASPYKMARGAILRRARRPRRR